MLKNQCHLQTQFLVRVGWTMNLTVCFKGRRKKKNYVKSLWALLWVVFDEIKTKTFFHQPISGIPLEIWLHFTPWWFKKYFQWRLIFKGGYFRTAMLQSGVLKCQKKKSNSSLNIHTCNFFLPTKGMDLREGYFVDNFHSSNFQFGVFSHLLLVNSHPFLMVMYFFSFNHPCRSQSLEESGSDQLTYFSVITDQRCSWSSEDATSYSISPAPN